MVLFRWICGFSLVELSGKGGPLPAMDPKDEATNRRRIRCGSLHPHIRGRKYQSFHRMERPETSKEETSTP